MNKIEINNINQGGMAQSKYEGRKYSVAKLVGIDLHSTPGLIRANYKLKKDSSTYVTELVKNIVPCSNGNTYFFSYESGKIWSRGSGGTWSLVHTTAASSGESKCLGAMEFNGYIYWATEEKLFRIAVADTGDWSASVEWQSFTVGDTEFHPMVAFDNRLRMGDGYYVAQVDLSDAFTPDALDLPSEQRIKSISKIDNQLAIGTIVDNNVGKSTIYRWDGWSVSWNMDDTIEENGINAYIPVDNYFYVQAGRRGTIYSYDGSMMSKETTIPGNYDSNSEVVVEPNGVAYFQGLSLFGASLADGATDSGTTNGVYSYATRNPIYYPRVLAIEYLTSTNSNTTEIGAMAVQGANLFVAWKDGSNYGVDVIDYSNRYSGAVIESRVIYIDRMDIDNFQNLSVGYVSLPEGCSIKLYSKSDYADTWTELTTAIDTIRKKVYSEITLEGTTLEVKVELICSGASTPEIDSIELSDR